MADATIRHRVDLAVSFIDRTTGMPATGGVSLSRDGANAHFRISPDGIALFIDAGREDFLLGVDVAGYEHEDAQIEYAALDNRLPYLEVPLIPQDAFGENYVTIDGGLPGLTAVDAVCAEASAWVVAAFDAGKGLLTARSVGGGGKELGGRHYAIVAGDGTGYAPVEIRGKAAGKGNRFGTGSGTGDGDAYLADAADAAPEGDASGLPLARRVTGRVSDGACLLRLPNGGGRREWIVRASVDGKNEFRLFYIDEAEEGAAGRRIGIDEIMSRAAPGMADTREHDAEWEGG